MRPGRSFRMILNAEGHPGRIPDSFQRVIIKIDMRNLGVSGKGLPQHVKSMILGSDLNTAAQQIFNRLIDPVMSEFELGCLCADSLREKLIPKTDTEYRHLSQKTLDRFNLMGQGRGIAGSV